MVSLLCLMQPPTTWMPKVVSDSICKPEGSLAFARISDTVAPSEDFREKAAPILDDPDAFRLLVREVGNTDALKAAGLEEGQYHRDRHFIEMRISRGGRRVQLSLSVMVPGWQHGGLGSCKVWEGKPSTLPTDQQLFDHVVQEWPNVAEAVVTEAIKSRSWDTFRKTKSAEVEKMVKAELSDLEPRVGAMGVPSPDWHVSRFIDSVARSAARARHEEWRREWEG